MSDDTSSVLQWVKKSSSSLFLKNEKIFVNLFKFIYDISTFNREKVALDMFLKTSGLTDWKSSLQSYDKDRKRFWTEIDDNNDTRNFLKEYIYYSLLYRHYDSLVVRAYWFRKYSSWEQIENLCWRIVRDILTIVVNESKNIDSRSKFSREDNPFRKRRRLHSCKTNEILDRQSSAVSSNSIERRWVVDFLQS